MIIGLGLLNNARLRASLWREKRMGSREVLFVILGLRGFKYDQHKLNKFIKTHLSKLSKADMIAVLNELQRQEEIFLALKTFHVIRKQHWYKPDVILYKNLIIALLRSKRMEEAMELWEAMRSENLFPDCETYSEVIHGLLWYGLPKVVMSIYEDMKRSPDPPEELPFRILLKGLLPYPLLRKRVKKDFEKIFPERRIYGPSGEIFGKH